MATTPVTPTPVTPTPVTPTPEAVAASTVVSMDKDLQTSLASLAHKHVAVSYTLIGVLLFVLACGGVGAYFASKWIDKEIAQAQTAEKLFTQEQAAANQANQLYQNEVTAHNTDRAQWAAQQAQLIQAYSQRNTQVNTQIQAVTQPGKSAQDAFSDLHSAYKDNPTVESATLNVSADPLTKEQLLTFSVPTVQQLTATKIDRDRLSDNVDDLNDQLGLQTQTIGSLKTDLSNGDVALKTEQKATADCKQAMTDYKKVVTPTRLKRILGGVWKGTIFAGGVALGVAIGHFI